MSTILAFEASGEQCSVSLSVNHKTQTLVSHQPRAHATHLLPFTEQLLAEHQYTLSDVDAIACATGPGSFTGLRIALSVAQGLAYASDKPVISVNSLAAMTVPLKESQAALVLPLVDARMDEVYWGAYGLDGQSRIEQKALMGARAGFEDALNALLHNLTVNASQVLATGQAWHSIDYAKNAAQALGIRLAPEDTRDKVSAAYVVSLAQVAWEKGDYVSPQAVDLYYCRDSIAWNKRTRIRESSSLVGH
ncbi:tRNA (adenosine(37)-N6)-threonylcarbamoyltransferase complex dimerization subunit type 1 TsaB [Marinagarivorans algicola]|uniref:tRNA (adenosine(37)-N6)-threonylcarbamoyltransferase complex dimerization subunit type 1 TsaB n=1 Tax=Marinagarivorans algicola TaxID=1513270 RepID=UPI0006B5053E|nr:tRNA (adenosine(37)-N6)-threonylcarbamoyltransferase complex dimerization subunit type 1 TsaB [Marinagarivorans algicola]